MAGVAAGVGEVPVLHIPNTLAVADGNLCSALPRAHAHRRSWVPALPSVAPTLGSSASPTGAPTPIVSKCGAYASALRARLHASTARAILRVAIACVKRDGVAIAAILLGANPRVATVVDATTPLALASAMRDGMAMGATSTCVRRSAHRRAANAMHRAESACARRRGTERSAITPRVQTAPSAASAIRRRDAVRVRLDGRGATAAEPSGADGPPSAITREGRRRVRVGWWHT